MNDAFGNIIVIKKLKKNTDRPTDRLRSESFLYPMIIHYTIEFKSLPFQYLTR